MATELSHIEIGGISVPMIYEKNSTLGIVNIQLIFEGVGLIANEIPGLSSLSAKLFNEGSKRLGAVKFAKELENRAITLYASSGVETFSFELSMLKEHKQAGISLFLELLSDPNLTKESVAKIKTEAKTSLLHKESDFDYVAMTALNRRIFAGTPLEHPKKGDFQSIDLISIKDIKRFISQNLLLERAIVLVGGDIEPMEISKELAKILAILPRGKAYQAPFYEPSSHKEIEYIQRASKQSYIHFATPFAFSDFRESYKAKVAGFVLGSSGFGSRIMEAIRVERGLAYSAYWRINLNKSSSYSYGYLQTEMQTEQEAINVVHEIISEFIAHGITKEELDDAKKFLLGSEPLRNETLGQRLGSAFIAYYRGLPLDYAKEELEQIASLTLDEINEYIKEHGELSHLTISVVHTSQAPDA